VPFFLQAEGLFISALTRGVFAPMKMNIEEVARRSGGGASVASPALRICSRLLGPSNSIAARNAMVCSGATANPLARNSATKEMKI
jgi:hypothetical protein